MLGLSIISLEILVKTSGGLFSVEIPFEPGLNIIRAENSSGKSTCVNAIAYGLGLEAVLGPSKKRPFPKSLYKVIHDNKKDENEYCVHGSSLKLKIKNSDGLIALLKRDVLGNENKISVDSSFHGGDFFLGASGEVGSHKSEKGFHHWLINFLGWDIPNVTTFDGKEIPLYLECIFPLFFIEQKRGWSEIQANMPIYGIKNAKKAAVEFCLGIDSFKYENRINQYIRKISDIESQWDKFCSKVLNIADFKNVQVIGIGELNFKISPYPIIFKYLENSVYLSIDEKLLSLNRMLKEVERDVARNTPDNEILNAQRNIVNSLTLDSENLSDSIDKLMLSISDIEGKLNKLSSEYDKYNQLKRLKAVGAELGSVLDTQKCPICESELYDTLGRRVPSRSPMTLEENIVFLKNQKDFFGSIKKKFIYKLERLRRSWNLTESKLTVEQDKLSDLRADFNDLNGVAKSKIRDQLQIEILQKDVLKLKEVEEDLNKQLIEIYSEWVKVTTLLKEERGRKKDIGRDAVIRKLQATIRANLADFKFKNADIKSVSISHRTLRPEQEGYDIVAETSASDYIRIIWSYTLALLELAGQDENSGVKHGGFVVFDEPRQHEANMISFTGLIEKASKFDSFGGQIIIATSLEEAKLEEACQDTNANLVYFDDYVLTLSA